MPLIILLLEAGRIFFSFYFLTSQRILIKKIRKRFERIRQNDKSKELAWEASGALTNPNNLMKDD